MSQTRPYNKWGIRSNLSWNEKSSHFGYRLFWELELRFEEKKPFLGFQLFKQREGKEVEKKSRYGIYVWITCMELWYGNLSLSRFG